MEISTIYGINSSIDSSVSNKTNNKIDKSPENQKENTTLRPRKQSFQRKAFFPHNASLFRHCF